MDRDSEKPQLILENFPMDLNLRIKLFLGTGGVGKTTLSAIYAIKLANEFPNKKIKLVTIDPSKRLRDYFDMNEFEFRKQINNLTVEANDRRELFEDFILEAYKGDEIKIKEIQQNKIFNKLMGGLAVSQEFTSLYEVYRGYNSDIDYLIIDSPPLQNASAFLSGAADLEALFSSSLAKFFIPDENLGILYKILFKAKKKSLELLSILTGRGFTAELASFFGVVDQVRPKLLEVLRASKKILKEDTEIICMCNHNELSLGGMYLSLQMMREKGLSVRKYYINKYDEKLALNAAVQKKFEKLKSGGGEAVYIPKFNTEPLTYDDLLAEGLNVEL